MVGDCWPSAPKGEIEEEEDEEEDDLLPKALKLERRDRSWSVFYLFTHKTHRDKRRLVERSQLLAATRV